MWAPAAAQLLRTMPVLRVDPVSAHQLECERVPVLEHGSAASGAAGGPDLACYCPARYLIAARQIHAAIHAAALTCTSGRDGLVAWSH
jgi:hypothetical protein